VKSGKLKMLPERLSVMQSKAEPAPGSVRVVWSEPQEEYCLEPTVKSMAVKPMSVSSMAGKPELVKQPAERLIAGKLLAVWSMAAELLVVALV